MISVFAFTSLLLSWPYDQAGLRELAWIMIAMCFIFIVCGLATLIYCKGQKRKAKDLARS